MINDSEILLRKTEVADLEFFFTFQLDNEENYLAASHQKTQQTKQYTFRSTQNFWMTGR